MNTYGLLSSSSTLSQSSSENSFRSLSKKAFNGKPLSEAISELSEIIMHNAMCAQNHIKFCAQNNIKLYSIFNDLIPLLHDDSIPCSIKDLSDYESIIKELKKIGIIARKFNVKICVELRKQVLLSGTETTIKKSLNLINLWSTIFDLFELDQGLESPIIIQVNNSVNESEELKLKNVIDKFYNSFENLPESSQSRVSVTNEKEGCWNCQNLFKWLHLYCGGEYGKFFPLVYNNLNHKLNPSIIGGKEVSDKQNVEAFKHTWPENNIPCFFWNEEPLDDAFSKEIPSFGEDIGWICCGINSDQNIFQMKGIVIKDENLNLSSFDDLLSVKVEIDDSEINETEIDIAHKKIKEALETKGGSGFNSIYGF